LGKSYNPAVIPEVGIQLPPGRFVFRIGALDDSQETGTGKYQIKAPLRVEEPAAFAGCPHTENFVIGTTDDPQADTEAAWKSYAAGRYRKLLEKAGIELTGDVTQDNQAAEGQLVGGIMMHTIEPPLDKLGQPNPYGGRTRVQIGDFFRVGDREPGLDPVPGAPTSAPTTPPPNRPTSPPRQTPPAQTHQQPAAGPAKPKAQANSKQTLPCGICNQRVPRDEYPQHVEMCSQS
jgi:hypothetical protein